MSSRSGLFKVYKNSGAAQFSLIPPRRDDEKGFVTKDGAVLLEVAPCEGKDADGNIRAFWDRKITFAISIADIASLMDTTKDKIRLFHQFQGSNKAVEFQAGKDQYAGTYMLIVQSTQDGKTDKVSVPLTNGEYNLIMRLLVGTAAPKILGWD